MINWLYSHQITGKIEYPQLWDSSRILIQVISPLTPVWRKAGYLKIEIPFGGEFFTVDYRPIEFGNSLISISAREYRLSFEPVINLVALYPNTSISIYQLTPTEIHQIQIMAISNPVPTIPVVGGDAVSIVVSAAVSTVLLAANPNRAPEGLIVNNATRNLWIVFSATAATAAPPAIKVSGNGGAIDIPGSYTGIITGIWEAGTTGTAVVHEFSYQ
jgi:hypothetical protein